MLSKFRNLFLLLPIIKFRVEEESMLPTLKPGETIFVNRFYYLLKDPKVSDVIVFKKSDDNMYLVKRITKIVENKYFVIGDNHTKSKEFGPISRRNILGKVILL